MTSPSNANTSGLVEIAYARIENGKLLDLSRLSWGNYEPLVTAASAQARIAELEAERDIAQSAVEAWAHVCESLEAHLQDRVAMRDEANPERYLNILRSNIARVLKDSEQIRAARWADSRRSNDRATAAEARADRLAEIASKLDAAIGWLDYPFIDNRTPEAELRQRVGFMMKDAEPHRAALQQETQP